MTSLLPLAAEGVRAGSRQLDWIRLTEPQRAFLSDTATIALWRDGNQLGKSTALALDAIHRARGTHPFQKTHRPPVDGLVIGVSWDQMIPLMKKIWTFVPKDEIDPGNSFRPGFGITGKPPRIAFIDGPGAGSVIHFATYRQGSTRIAGATLHFVTMDEPPTEAMYGEVVPRVLRQRGHIRIGMTPTPDMPDQTWLRALVESGRVSEHNYGLEAKYCWPEGFKLPWVSEAEVTDYEGSLLEIEREMRMRGAWDPVVTGRWLAGFTGLNVRDTPAPPADAFYGVGVDHGTAVGKQAAVLIAVAGRGTDRPRVWYLDEYTTEDASTPEDDAAAILEMLERNDVPVDAVDLWVGDIQARSRHDDAKKSNKLLRRELARQLDRKTRAAPAIYPVRKFAGSVGFGLRQMNSLFVRRDDEDVPDGMLHSRCAMLRKACQQFAGDSHDPLKDVLDAARYITEMAVKPSRAKVTFRARSLR